MLSAHQPGVLERRSCFDERLLVLSPPPHVVYGHRCTQGNYEGIQSEGGSRGFCGPTLLLLHLQPSLQTQRHLDSGSLLQSRNPNSGVNPNRDSTCTGTSDRLNDVSYELVLPAFCIFKNHFNNLNLTTETFHACEYRHSYWSKESTVVILKDLKWLLSLPGDCV